VSQPLQPYLLFLTEETKILQARILKSASPIHRPYTTCTSGLIVGDTCPDKNGFLGRVVDTVHLNTAPPSIIIHCDFSLWRVFHKRQGKQPRASLSFEFLQVIFVRVDFFLRLFDSGSAPVLPCFFLSNSKSEDFSFVIVFCNY